MLQLDFGYNNNNNNLNHILPKHFQTRLLEIYT